MKILIAGSTGFLGTKLARILSGEFDVVGLDHSQLDITDMAMVAEKIKELMPSAVINAAAFADVDRCEIEKKKAYDVNVNGVKSLIAACRKYDVKLIHFSTDFVFDGNKGNYSEEDEAYPVNYYGKTKLEAEQLIKESGISHIIARVCMLYGYNGDNSERSFARWVFENLKEGKQINVFTDYFGTPTLVDDIAIAVAELLKTDKKGIYHVSGPERISRHDLAVKISETFKFRDGLINPVASDQLKQTAKRPRDTSLNISRLLAEGVLMSDVYTGLKKMKEQMER